MQDQPLHVLEELHAVVVSSRAVEHFFEVLVTQAVVLRERDERRLELRHEEKRAGRSRRIPSRRVQIPSRRVHRERHPSPGNECQGGETPHGSRGFSVLRSPPGPPKTRSAVGFGSQRVPRR